MSTADLIEVAPGYVRPPFVVAESAQFHGLNDCSDHAGVIECERPKCYQHLGRSDHHQTGEGSTMAEGNSTTPTGDCPISPEEAKLIQQRIRSRRHYVAHREAEKERHRQYRKKDPEKTRAARKRYYDKESREKRNAQCRKWREAHPGYGKKKYAENREALLALGKEYRAKNKTSIEERRLKDRLACLGIDYEEYNLILELQGGVCAICGSQSASKYKKIRLYIDHCHKTGLVRGLLCRHCNSVLGFMNDNPELLRKAADYLEEWRDDEAGEFDKA
jgi:hypothetical protein